MEREEMPVDVVFVGAGPGGLAGSIHLMNLIEAHNAAVESGDKQGDVFDEPMICVLEKGSEVGAHSFSGAVLDPRALDELVPDWRERGDFPVERFVEREAMVMLRQNGKHLSAPWLPPELHNMGKPIVSLGRMCKWLAEIAEEKGVNIFPGFAGTELLYDGDKVVGVRTGDKGLGKDGEQKGNFEPGMDLTATATILTEGPRGSLSKDYINKHSLDSDCNPMAYEVGCKEVLELPEGAMTDGFVAHGVGWPLDDKTFGGWFLYALEGDKACVGMLVATDAADPYMDPHYMLQKLKTHPYIRGILGGGKVVKYGAKTVTIGGWGSVPKLYTDGCMIAGDSASFLNPMRVKGIHLSMKSAMLAAEAAFDAMVRGDSSAEVLKAYHDAVHSSWIRQEMEPAKNMHAHFSDGLVRGIFRMGADYVLGAGDLKTTQPDHSHMAKAADFAAPEPIEYDGTYLMDKVTSVYHSGTVHEEQQPCHLKVTDTEICATKCKEEYGNPCQAFCPAQVYNMRPNEATGRDELEIDFGNCVHCKTCDIRDPYQIITWVPTEGGNGPEYHLM